MKNTVPFRQALFGVLFCLLLAGGPVRAQEGPSVPAGGGELRDFLDRECTNLDKEKLQNLLAGRFGDELSPEHSPDLRRIMEGVVKRADFDSVSEEKTVELIALVHDAHRKGAPLEFLDEVYDVAYATPMTAERLAAAANALRDFHRSDVPREIYEEFIFHAIENQWDPADLPVLARGLIYGVDRGLPPDKVALIIMLDVKNGALQDKGPERLVLDAVKLVRESEPSKWRPMDRAERDAAARQERTAALARSREEVGRELQERERAFRQAQQELAVLREYPDARLPADAERLSRELEQRIRKLQAEIMQYQARQGAITVELDSTRKAVEERQAARERERNRRRERELERTKMQVAGTGRKGRLDRERLFAVVDRYLGTPYRFGGDSTQGIDCSAFARRVYRGQGIELPRNSRDQARVGSAVPFGDLRPGDLVFFDTSINGVISHVGVYLGDGVFAHASSSKGVTKSSIRERYYVKRFVRGGRIFND